MARRRSIKRAPKKPEPSQTRKSGRTRHRSNSVSNTDYVSLARNLGFLLLICGICGFLFYPDIIKAMEKLRDMGDQTADADVSSEQKVNENTIKDVTSSFSREGDLMEDELPLPGDPNPTKPRDIKTHLNGKASSNRGAESVEADIRQKREADDQAPKNQNKENISRASRKERQENVPKEGNRGQNMQSDPTRSSSTIPRQAVKRDEGKAREADNDSPNTNKKTHSNTNKNPEKIKMDSIATKKTDFDNDKLHEKPIEDLRSRDGKRKPIILRPGNSQFSIDLSKNMEENVRIHEKRGDVNDKSKNAQSGKTAVNKNQTMKKTKTSKHTENQENKQMHQESQSQAKNAKKYQKDDRKSANDEKPDRNNQRKPLAVSSGDSKMALDPSRVSNSDSIDKSRAEVKKKREIHKQKETVNHEKQNKLENDSKRLKVKEETRNPKSLEDKTSVESHPGSSERDGKRKPIILSADNAEITIDASDIMLNSNGEYHIRPSPNNKADTKVKKKQDKRKEVKDNVQKASADPKEKEKGAEKGGNSDIKRQKSPQLSETPKNSPKNNADSKSTQKLKSNKDDENEKAQRSPNTEKASLNVNDQQSQPMRSSPVGTGKHSDIENANKKTPQTDKSHKKTIKTKEGLDKKPSHLHTEKSKGSKKQQNAKKGTAEKDRTADDIDNFKAVYQTTFTPKKIFDGGRRIPPIELLPQKKTNSSVRVFLFDDFLSERECDGLMKAHDSHVKAMSNAPLMCFDGVATLRRHIKEIGKSIKVTPTVFTKGTKCLNASFSSEIQTLMKSNWSYSTAFYTGESTFSQVAATRIQRAMGLNPENGGKFQMTSYPTGKAYKTHTDCTLNGSDERDRVVSVLMYLNTVEDGGETKFPELGIWVKPRKGRAIIWNNMSPKGFCEPHSQHVASVVKTGSKYILIRWYYYKNFYHLGKRPHPPELPARGQNVPMVMCDEYNMGSCRWYDEWSYDALLAYQRQRADGLI